MTTPHTTLTVNTDFTPDPPAKVTIYCLECGCPGAMALCPKCSSGKYEPPVEPPRCPWMESKE